MTYQAFQEKRQLIAGKTVIGIDPGKDKHQVSVLSPTGAQLGVFTFENNYNGYHNALWKKLSRHIKNIEQTRSSVAFSVETSCNLWQNLTYYLNASGWTTLLVSPLTTHHSRPFINHDFSHSDPKDALLMASNAQSGYFDFYRTYSISIGAMHELSLIYSKIRKDILRQQARLRAYLEYVFPEFLDVLRLDTVSARFLLRRYFLPEHFLALDVGKVGEQLFKISRGYFGKETLEALQEKAQQTIGIQKQGAEVTAGRLAINAWLDTNATLQKQTDAVLSELIPLAKQTPGFDSLVSLKGVSDKLSALFIAETRDLASFKHYKQIEKAAGFNLRLLQSGRFVGRRVISHIGNRRLAWVLYKMLEGTARYVPEVRIKFLKRQLKQPRYRKNLIACTPVLLKLVLSLVKEGRTYEARSESQEQVKGLEAKLAEQKKKKNKK